MKYDMIHGMNMHYRNDGCAGDYDDDDDDDGDDDDENDDDDDDDEQNDVSKSNIGFLTPIYFTEYKCL